MKNKKNKLVMFTEAKSETIIACLIFGSFLIASLVILTYSWIAKNDIVVGVAFVSVAIIPILFILAAYTFSPVMVRVVGDSIEYTNIFGKVFNKKNVGDLIAVHIRRVKTNNGYRSSRDYICLIFDKIDYGRCNIAWKLKKENNIMIVSNTEDNKKVIEQITNLPIQDLINNSMYNDLKDKFNY